VYNSGDAEMKKRRRD